MITIITFLISFFSLRRGGNIFALLQYFYQVTKLYTNMSGFCRFHCLFITFGAYAANLTKINIEIVKIDKENFLNKRFVLPNMKN